MTIFAQASATPKAAKWVVLWSFVPDHPAVATENERHGVLLRTPMGYAVRAVTRVVSATCLLSLVAVVSFNMALNFVRLAGQKAGKERPTAAIEYQGWLR
jgi:hypothetical protein